MIKDFINRGDQKRDEMNVVAKKIYSKNRAIRAPLSDIPNNLIMNRKVKILIGETDIFQITPRKNKKKYAATLKDKIFNADCSLKDL